MAQFAGTIPLSDIERIQIYYKKKKNTKAGMKQILAETGGDIVMNAAFFLNNLKPCCHLKVDGAVKCTPNYKALAITWNTPADFRVAWVPTGDANYMESRAIIAARQKKSVSDIKASVAYATNRTAIGVKEGRFAYYVTTDNLTPAQLQTILFDAGWSDAIMMDGGGSTAILFADGTGFAGDGRTVPFWIVIHLKKDGCPYPVPTKTIYPGANGTDVRWLQWMLNECGAAPRLNVDGDFGPKTETALVLFQKKAFPDQKNEWDGVCGPKTRKELLAKC